MDRETKWLAGSAESLCVLNPDRVATADRGERMAHKLMNLLKPLWSSTGNMIVACDGDICYYLHVTQTDGQLRVGLEAADENNGWALTERIVKEGKRGEALLSAFLVDHPQANCMVVDGDGQNRRVILIDMREDAPPLPLSVANLMLKVEGETDASVRSAKYRIALEAKGIQLPPTK